MVDTFMRTVAIIGCALGIGLFLSDPASAQWVSWQGNLSNDFTVGGNWDVGAFPRTDQNPIVTGGTQDPLISSDCPNAVNILLVGNFGNGLLSMTGGSITVNSYIAMGRGDGVFTGEFNVAGGAVTVAGGGGKVDGVFGTVLAGSYSGQNATGKLVVSDTGVYRDNGVTCVGYNGTGILTIAGGTYTTAGMQVGRWAASSGTVNLDGGVLNNTSPSWGFGNHLGKATFNFNGGTLQAGASWTFAEYYKADKIGSGVYVKEGGAKIDTNGFTTTIAAVLRHEETVDTDGGLLKSGEGTLILTGDNTYNGATVINAGTLQVGDGGLLGTLGGSGEVVNQGTLIFNRSDAVTLDRAITGAGALTKAGSGTLTLTAANLHTGGTTVNAGKLCVNGSLDTAGAVTVAGGAGLGGLGSAGLVNVSHGGAIEGGQNGSGTLTLSSLTFSGAGTLNITPGAAGYTPLRVTEDGGLAAYGGDGSVSVNVNGSKPATGTYHIAQYTGFLGGGIDAWKIGSVPGGGHTTYSLLDSNGYIDLSVANDVLIWTGAAGTEWSLNAIAEPKNWKLQSTGAGVDYLEDDEVLFDDSAAGTTVDLSVADVNPYSVTFNNSTKDYALQGGNAIAGPTGLTKNGDGKLTVSNNNTYTGATAIQRGTLVLGVDNALPTGSAVSLGGAGTAATLDLAGVNQQVAGLNIDESADPAAQIIGNSSTTADSILTFNGTTPSTFGGTIQDSVAGGTHNLGLTVAGGSLALTGENTYTGPTNLNGGVLQFSSLGNLGNGGAIHFNGGTLQYNGNTDDITAREVTFHAGGGTIDTNGQYVSFANAMSGEGGLTKAGEGELVLTAANTFSGDTKVSGGTLALAHAEALAASTLDYNSYGGTLSFGDLTEVTLGALKGNQEMTLEGGFFSPVTLTVGGNNADTAYGGRLSGSGSLIKTGSGTMQWSAVNNSMTGSISVLEGTLELTGNGDLFNGIFTDGVARTFTVATGATLRLRGDWQTERGAAVSLEGGTLHVVSGLVGDSNQYLNTVTMTGGAITGNALRLNNIAAANYTILASDTGSSISTPLLMVKNGGNPATATFTVEDGEAADDLVLSGAISDMPGYLGSAVVKTGPGKMTLTADNTYVGPVRIDEGTLQVGDGGTTGTLGGSGEVVNHGTLTFNRSDAVDFKRPISGLGGVTQAGTGKLVLSGVNTYIGPTNVAAGTLRLGVEPVAMPTDSLLWLDATDAATVTADEFTGLVSAWASKGSYTGSVTAADAAQPSYAADGINGLPVIRFAGNPNVMTDANLLTAANFPAQEATLFVVYNPRNDDWYKVTETGACQYGGLYRWQDGQSRFGDFRTGTYNDRVLVPIAQDSLTHVFTTMSGTGAGSYNIWRDGSLLATRDPKWGLAPVFEVGTELSGDVAEILIYNRALTEAERLAVESYLNGKWLGTSTSGGGLAIPDTSMVSVAAGATLEVGAFDETIGPLSGEGSVVLGAGHLTVNSSDGFGPMDSTYSGEISGTAGLVKIGEGTLELAHANTYEGRTTVQAGTLLISAAGALPAGGGLTIEAEGTVVLASGLAAGAQNASQGATAVPEPGTMVLLAAAVAGLLALGWRRKRG